MCELRSLLQVLSVPDDAERQQLQLKLLDSQQMLRTGPGGDVCSYLQRKKRAFILAMLLGRQVPLKAGALRLLVSPDPDGLSLFQEDTIAGYRQEALKIKQEYHSFRSGVAQLMLLFSALLVFAMHHAAAAADASRVHTFHIMKGVLRHSFSPIIMVSVQVCLCLEPHNSGTKRCMCTLGS
jgi:hypothetical protein